MNYTSVNDELSGSSSSYHSNVEDNKNNTENIYMDESDDSSQTELIYTENNTQN